MRLRTRLTDMLGIEHPILLAPMNVIAGGKLAAAVTGAGGLGLIGGGYGDGSSGNTRQQEMHGSDAGSLLGRWRETRRCSIRFSPSGRRP